MPREKEGAHVQEVLHVAAHRYVPDEPGDPPAKAGTALLGPSAELTTGTREEEQTLTRGALSVYKGSALELEDGDVVLLVLAEDAVPLVHHLGDDGDDGRAGRLVGVVA